MNAMSDEQLSQDRLPRQHGKRGENLNCITWMARYSVLFRTESPK